MAVELAEVAAGLPLAASFAVVGGIGTLREGRRRTALNEAMHELRRPLQLLSLALPGDPGNRQAVDSSLRLVTAALDRLDREINGEPATGEMLAVPVRALLEEAVQRWSTQASTAGCAIRLHWLSDEQLVAGNQVELAQAVDNVISNAFDHGGGKVTIECRREGTTLLLSIRDSGGDGSRGRRMSLHPRHGGYSRHGHGLRVVARVVRAHGGSFSLRCRKDGAEALLRLPLLLAEEDR